MSIARAVLAISRMRTQHWGVDSIPRITDDFGAGQQRILGTVYPAVQTYLAPVT